MYFLVPGTFVYADTYKFEREQNDVQVNRVPGVCWFSSIDHGRRHQQLQLMSMADNLRYNKKLKGTEKYDCYDNYDAIEVPFTDAIPSDYKGVMGVPITFLDKYSPEQFEIIGCNRGVDQDPAGVYGRGIIWMGLKLLNDCSSSTRHNMETTLKQYTVKEVCVGFVYNESEGKGLFGLSGRLTIQPEYQRS